MSEPQAISPIKLNAQIAEIEQQRNTAMTRCAKLAGDNAELIDLVKILRAENERLEEVVKRQSSLMQDTIDREGAMDVAVEDQN